MKRSKKSRVSWPPGPLLCQVKIFRTEDCPAKVASQPQRHNFTKISSGKPRAPDLPPGFEGSHYADKLNVSNIPRIKWKRPPKFLVNDALLIGDGVESTERRTENLRITKVLEAIYPHRSTIPSRPSVSPAVEAESFDDSKTPVIRLTPIEDEWEPAEESTHSVLESNKQGQLETKPPSSPQEPVSVSGLAPDLSLAASAALAALMKTKEQGSMVDPELLIKLLTDPKMIKNLITDTTGKLSETENQPVDTGIDPTRLVPQHFTASTMARKPQPPVIIPQKQSLAASQPLTNPDRRRVSPPKPGNGNITQLNPPRSIPMPVQFSVGIATEPSLPARLPSSSLPISLNLQRPQHAFSEPKVIVKPQPQPQPQHTSAFRTSEMNNVQASVGFGRYPQTGFDTYPMNLNGVDANGRLKPIVQPLKGLDYFKNLIREHGTVNHENTQYHSQTGKFNGRFDQIKVQKQCIYYGTARGCKLGDSCVYVHDRVRPSFEAEAPRAKRLKFGRYEKNGF
ncbi:hypothetical protein EUTSA_v10010301mg [Eutrema salsugineum]|uniref:C3H1-type domain-containing protein n=1 Tax=Eutrema salsugineum TaxID=72664 RepID=V4NGT2_EUTSA|nr:zinc finger CCCH domain-containing protein 45 [Eutrema salsugineum]ESQ45396.1 hypothetical protein EUTSA_v10010301mg [Eutrema salsugineum]